MEVVAACASIALTIAVPVSLTLTNLKRSAGGSEEVMLANDETPELGSEPGAGTGDGDLGPLVAGYVSGAGRV